MKKNQPKSPFIFLVLALCLILTSSGKAQTIDELRKSASDLIKQNKYIEALPLLEKIAKADPNDAEVQFDLGFALISKATATNDETTRRQLRIQSRNAFLKSRSLGKDSPLLDGMIESISPDGVEKGKFSFNKEAEDFMRDAEASFAKGDLDDAFDKYQKALTIDPKIYYAALFSGDVFKEKGDFFLAEVWYKKAIAINPYIETAYRYSATPLMKQKKYDEALVRYIESYITEPYSKFAISGLTQWGQATGKRLGHPRIDIPELEIGADGKAKSTVNINPLADDGSMAWMSYVT
ncbi:MAG TPA: tetratricopeptide repeat protein, partial [Pyrinomonadaceae bacterium]|nr:tetratricopeptide repeat protein [Pyrinomonadaceae bacterium]